MPIRLGGHVLAGIWIFTASRSLAGVARGLGLLLGVLLIAHAFLSPWLPPWAIFPPFVLIPIWLVLVGRRLAGFAGIAAKAAA